MLSATGFHGASNHPGSKGVGTTPHGLNYTHEDGMRKVAGSLVGGADQTNGRRDELLSGGSEEATLTDP